MSNSLFRRPKCPTLVSTLKLSTLISLPVNSLHPVSALIHEFSAESVWFYVQKANLENFNTFYTFKVSWTSMLRTDILIV
jgi:hypothetical protein